MEYRKLGKSGVKLSQLSLGSWVTFQNQLDIKKAERCMSAAYDYGVNFFDNAEIYANGKSEEIMGKILRKMTWPRMKYLVSTKFFWGISDGPNEKNTLNRKYLMTAIEGSLKRLKLEYVDLVYCHRPDPETPMEEVVWAMHDMVSRGYALYWGTSEWSAEQIKKAFQVAEKHHLRKPVVEQPQYNLLHREKVEKEFSPLYKEDYGIGLTTWSPLASGLLTGKYLNNKIPKGSRLSMKNLNWLKEESENLQIQNKVKNFIEIAKDYSLDPAALALAWCTKNPNVSSVITGASSVEQIHKNMKALDILPKLTNELMKKLDLLDGR